MFQPTDAKLGLSGSFAPDPADMRVAFYTQPISTAPFLGLKGFANTLDSSIPVFLPGEITLIKVEAYARQPDLGNALLELNKVVTNTPADPAF